MRTDRRRLLAVAAAGTLAGPAVARGAATRAYVSPTGTNARTFAFRQVDVFSSAPILGNPLAVVIGADSLDEARMAGFANWTNLSETAFLLKPTRADADYRVRIFTPERELAFAAGHPTLGSCHAWLAATAGTSRPVIVQECAATLTRIRRGAGRLAFAAPRLTRAGPVEPEILARVRSGLHLAPDAIVASSWVDNGPGWLAVMLRLRKEVLSLRPDYSLISGLHVGVVAPWNPARDGGDAQFEVRAFSAGNGGFEDPVTGSLNAGLATWLIGGKLARPSYVASQGTALRRMGRVFVELDGPDIWIGGAVTDCVSGTISL